MILDNAMWVMPISMLPGEGWIDEAMMGWPTYGLDIKRKLRMAHLFN